MQKLFVVLSLLFVMQPAYAQMQMPEITDAGCRADFNTIKDLMREANTCWDDTDCELHHYGCPWQLGICHYSLTGRDNKEERRKVYAKITEFEKDCMEEGTDLGNYCVAYNTEKEATLCDQHIKLLCVEGQCVTQTHVILQKGAGEGVDAYGSLEVHDGVVEKPASPEPNPKASIKDAKK